MKLKKIEIYGFKSFARRTEFQFGPGITAVVGPNGCGKSNLVDALRWVLGEQRPKLLRCSAMPDVVYRGSGAKVDAAEATLTFDNEDGTLAMDAPEVSITRRLSSDGISEYRINERSCRLRDVRELLLDTGLGVGGYSFMEQGRIDYILNASALERRMLVEEAAGTSRYRFRRKETLRKLEHTEQDLQRAGDMIQELERQVRSLKIQAGRARNYVDKRDRLSLLLHVWYGRRQRELEALLAECRADKELATAHKLELAAELAAVEGGLDERERQERSLSQEVAEIRTSWVEKRTRGELLEARRRDLEQRIERATAEREQGGERVEQVRSQIEELRQGRTSGELTIEELSERELAATQRRDECKRRLDEARAQERECDHRLDQLQGELLDVVEEQQRLRNEESDLRSEMRAIEGSRSKLETRSRELRTELDEQRRMCGHRRTLARRLAGERAELEATLSANDAELQHAFQERQRRSEALDRRHSQRSTDHSRLQVLEDAIARHEGVDEQVRALLARAAAGDPELSRVRGIVADWITAPLEKAKAVEAALGPWAEALVVEDREAAIEVLRVLRRDGADRVRILSLSELLRSRPQNGARPRLLEGADLNEVSEQLLPALLQPFDLLPDDVPLDLCSPLPGRALVSHEGEVMLNRYETVSTGRPEQLGLVTRRTEKDRLAKSVAALDAEIETAGKELAELMTRIAQRDSDREETARLREERTQQEREAQQSFRGTLERVKLLREELVLDRREVAELGERGVGHSVEIERLVAQSLEQESRREEFHERRRLVVAQRERHHEERKRVEAEQAELDLEAARLVERREAAVRAQQTLVTRILEREEECSHLEAHLEELHLQDIGVREEIAATAGEVEGLAAERQRIQQDLEDRTRGLQEFQERTREIREEVSELRRQWEIAGRSLQQSEMREHELRVQRDGLEEKSREDLDAGPAELEEALDAGSMMLSREMLRLREQRRRLEARLEGREVSDAAAEEGADAAGAEAAGEVPRTTPLSEEQREELTALREGSLETLKEEVDELRTALQRIGPVNLEAIAELDEVEGRAQFFTQQRDDLVESRRALRKMIEEIDRECEVRFEKTFAEVREQFRRLFRRLFRGGRADLLLQEDAADPSEAGVDVVAAPPGKEPRSLQMLSGGERTLTATALLFSLFSTRPSPFCVLDEVDAALDESNTERFTEMVKDFLGSSQFVIVTHSKRTMSAADTLYGVTMEGNGISRPIAMRFEEIVEESEQARGQSA